MALREVTDVIAKAIIITFGWYAGMAVRGYVEDGLAVRRALEYYSVVHKEDR